MYNSKNISLLLALFFTLNTRPMTTSQRTAASRLRPIINRSSYTLTTPTRGVSQATIVPRKSYNPPVATQTSLRNRLTNRWQPGRSFATKAVPSNANTILLIEAVQSGSKEKLYELIKRGLVDINARYENDETILHIAVKSASPEIVSILIDAGADLKAKDWHGYTPLHDAALHGQVEAAKLLVAKGANPNELNNKETTFTKVLPSFLRKTFIKGKCPLYLAQEKDRPSREILEIIRFLEPLTDKSLWFVVTPEIALRRAILSNNVKIVQHLLVEKKFSKNTLSLALIDAAGESDTSPEIVRSLIAMGADVNAKTNFWERTALHEAAYSGNLEAVKLVLAHEANPNVFDRYKKTPLDRAKERIWPHDNTPEIIRILEPLTHKPTKVSGGPMSIEDEISLLKKAIQSGKIAQLKQLLAQHNFSKEALNAALIEACEGGPAVRAEMIAILLDAGADINTRSGYWERTPLHIAADYSNPAAVKLLLARGANPNALDYKKRSPLYLAQEIDIPYESTLEVIQLLEPVTQRSLWFEVTPEIMLRRAVKRGKSEEVRSALNMDEEQFETTKGKPAAGTGTKDQSEKTDSSKQRASQQEKKTENKSETPKQSKPQNKRKFEKAEDELAEVMNMVASRAKAEEILGISLDSSEEEKRAAYFNWVRRHHPDQYVQDEDLREKATIILQYLNARLR